MAHNILKKKYFYYVFSLIFIFNFSFTSKASDTIKFAKKTIQVAHIKIQVEVADTNEKASQGLMFRKSMGDDEGMLFVFPSEEPRFFWMKNTFVDLSIAFINKEKKIIDIQDMKAVKSEMEMNPQSYPSKFPAQYALEMRLGWFKKHNIKVGDKLLF